MLELEILLKISN